MILNNIKKINGEMAIRKMSEKAQEAYHNSDPLVVYEDDGRYFCRGILELDNLTMRECESVLEELRDSWEEE